MKTHLLGLAALLTLTAAPAASSSADYGFVSSVYATASGAILFHTSGVKDGASPSCGAAIPSRFAIDASTVAGQAAASTLLTAYAMGKKVMVSGSGACTIWGDTETIHFIVIQN